MRSTLPLAFLTIFTVAFSSGNWPAELHVMNSGGFTAACKALAPAFEQSTGNTLSTAWGPSMGAAPEAIPGRLQRGEPAAVVIMVGSRQPAEARQLIRFLASPGAAAEVSKSGLDPLPLQK